MHYLIEPRDLRKSTTNTIKIASKRAIQKRRKSNLIGNKIADKIKASKKNSEEKAKNEVEKPKKRYISTEERRKIIDELRLV